MKVTFYILCIYNTLYRTYQLLYCTGHIEIISNYITIEVEVGEIEYQNVNFTFSMLRILLHYITLTNYYIVQDKLRLQVITAQ